MARLDGKVAIVTGASRGIGKGIAQRLAQEGARVVMTARGAERCTRRRVASRLQPGALGLVQENQNTTIFGCRSNGAPLPGT